MSNDEYIPIESVNIDGTDYLLVSRELKRMYGFHGVARIYLKNGGFFVKIPKDDELTTAEAIKTVHYERDRVARDKKRKAKYLADRKRISGDVED